MGKNQKLTSQMALDMLTITAIIVVAYSPVKDSVKSTEVVL